MDRWNEAIVPASPPSGDVLLTSTVIGGRYAIRLCVLNHTSDDADVPTPSTASRRPGSPIRTSRLRWSPSGPPVRAGVNVDWLGPRRASAPQICAGVAAFAAVPDEEARRFLAAGREERYAAGAAVTARWELGADVLPRAPRPAVGARSTAARSTRWRPGDHFGEIAAIDWGRDFSYGRTATVVALEPTTVLAFPAAALRELMADCPPVDRAIRRIAQARLARR